MHWIGGGFLTIINYSAGGSIPQNEFLLLDGTPFMLLDGSDFLLLGSS
jgi:hypothetical protein